MIFGALKNVPVFIEFCIHPSAVSESSRMPVSQKRPHKRCSYDD